MLEVDGIPIVGMISILKRQPFPLESCHVVLINGVISFHQSAPRRIYARYLIEVPVRIKRYHRLFTIYH